MSRKHHPQRAALRRSRYLKAAALAVSACLALSACGSGTDDGTTTITFWDDNASPARTPLWKHIIKEFEAQNQSIDVEYVGIPIDSVQQKYDSAIAGDALPDVASVSTAFLANLAGRGVLEPLDDRLAQSGLNGKLSEQYLKLVRGSGPGDKLYELPYSANTGVLWYRKDWFEEQDVAQPETWEDFFTAAQELTDEEKNRYGFTIRGGAGSIPQMLAEVYAVSGVPTFFDEQGKTTLNSPENVKALERIAGMYKKVTPEADVNNDYPKMVAQFDGGDVAMMHHNLGSYQDHVEALGKENVLGVPLPPSEETGTYNVVSTPVSGVGVFKGDNTDAAWKFAQFVASAEMSSYWNEKVGQIPANTEVADDDWVQEAQPLKAAFETVNDPETNLVQLPYYLPQFNPITKTDMEPLYQQVLLGEKSAQDFLDESAKMLNKAKAGYDERNGE